MKIEVTYYNDGVTIEREDGNKIFVKYEMFKVDYRQRRNCVAFAVGEMILDDSYRNSSVLQSSYKTVDDNYLK